MSEKWPEYEPLKMSEANEKATDKLFEVISCPKCYQRWEKVSLNQKIYEIHVKNCTGVRRYE
jgi:hypothetical protein